MKLKFFFVFVTLALLYQPANALIVVNCSEEKSGLLVIEAQGPIQKYDLSYIQRECMPREDQKFLFSINSPGGDVEEAIALGNWIRQSKRAVLLVRSNSICYSSCVFLVAGASVRFLDGQVGIHRPYFSSMPKGNINALLTALLAKTRAYMAKMNVREDLADAMFSTPPERIKILTKQELTDYRLSGVDIAVAEEAALKRAKELGISRSEYMQRLRLEEQLAVACLDPRLSLDEVIECNFAASRQAGR